MVFEICGAKVNESDVVKQNPKFLRSIDEIEGMRLDRNVIRLKWFAS